MAKPTSRSTGKPLVQADWYEVRRAQNAKPTTYRCPFCGKQLPSLTEHVLIRPLGEGTDRRHAHTQCALQARAAGGLPSRDEWRKAQPKRRGFWPGSSAATAAAGEPRKSWSARRLNAEPTSAATGPP